MLFVPYDAIWFSDLVYFVVRVASACRVELRVNVGVDIVFDMF